MNYPFSAITRLEVSAQIRFIQLDKMSSLVEFNISNVSFTVN